MASSPQQYKVTGAWVFVVLLLWMNLVLWGLYGVVVAFLHLVGAA